jgi:hypothetical protein
MIPIPISVEKYIITKSHLYFTISLATAVTFHEPNHTHIFLGLGRSKESVRDRA